jgi:aryl-alcohol dehydrogenase-like predicted oxidoreductase
MIILNPLEPWPGELVLEAAERNGVKVITRVVDYGGLFWGDLAADTPLAPGDHRGFRPAGWIEAGLERIDRMRPFADAAGLTPLQLACRWNLAHPAVECAVPTLIQEAGPGARAIEEKRAELAALAEGQPLSAEDVEQIRAVGDNTGCMALKGASAVHEGPDQPDRWALTDELAAAGKRFGIDPRRDLVKVG